MIMLSFCYITFFHCVSLHTSLFYSVIRMVYKRVEIGVVNIGRPTLITLDVLTTVDGGEIKVIEETANHYARIGPKLLNDRYGERVDTIKSDERGKGERIIREIYKTWMREDVNCSWATLTVCFRGCGLNRLAHDIEQHFGLPSPPELPKGYFTFLPNFDCYVISLT